MAKTHLDPNSENDKYIKIFMTISVIICIAIFLYSTIYEALSDPNGNISWIFFTIVFTFLMLLLSFYPMLTRSAGTRRAKNQIRQQEQAIQNTNPYKFYKELPNDYGIGVTSLLFDSTLENEKDIVAAILDLCAQKYLQLSKHSDRYVIRINPYPPKQPLLNEAYLLDHIRNNHIKQINYQTWYNYCLQDGVNLGLYHRTRIGLFQTPSKPYQNYDKIIKRFTAVGAIIFFAGIILLFLIQDSPSARTLAPIIVAVALGLGIGLPTILTIVFSFIDSRNRGIHEYYKSYKKTLENHLARTDKGIAELQKLYAFKSFLAQFNTFVDKNPEAVLLWDRYLSYAQVFGLTSSIMKSGYRELIDNSSFRIDNINNISLQNLVTSEQPNAIIR